MSTDTFRSRRRNIVGYWFADGVVHVTPGKEPLEHEVEIVPAGAVRRRVLNRDGTPAAVDVRVGTRVEFHYSPQRWTSFGINNVPVDLQGEFFLSPVPIGADKDLVICASRGHAERTSPARPR